MEYAERLRAPLSWWVVGLAVALTFVVAIGYSAGPAAGLVGAVLAVAVVGGGLLRYGAARITVDGRGLAAAGCLLEWDYLGAVEVLDAAATRFRLGPGADHAAHLLTRSYLPGSVLVEVADADDPHPYWLLSSRRPVDLAAAIERARIRR
ncbi:MAG TPA: DUF3093 domain-containing protein [Propionicimonas sp.]|nr:DUF3093 domain-containing protein [Propionicimonas sp.]